jgi:hypothetical protein
MDPIKDNGMKTVLLCIPAIAVAFLLALKTEVLVLTYSHGFPTPGLFLTFELAPDSWVLGKWAAAISIDSALYFALICAVFVVLRRGRRKPANPR